MTTPNKRERRRRPWFLYLLLPLVVYLAIIAVIVLVNAPVLGFFVIGGLLIVMYFVKQRRDNQSSHHTHIIDARSETVSSRAVQIQQAEEAALRRSTQMSQPPKGIARNWEKPELYQKETQEISAQRAVQIQQAEEAAPRRPTQMSQPPKGIARNWEKPELYQKETQEISAQRAVQIQQQPRTQTDTDYWMSLSGTDFEKQLGYLFGHLGYHVRLTPKTGDQGIDLILRKDRKDTIVQCKSHKSRIGPAVARELFGSMVHYGADGAILACTGGFTRGVEEFVRGKPIDLMSAADIATMARRISP